MGAAHPEHELCADRLELGPALGQRQEAAQVACLDPCEVLLPHFGRLEDIGARRPFLRVLFDNARQQEQAIGTALGLHIVQISFVQLRREDKDVFRAVVKLFQKF